MNVRSLMLVFMAVVLTGCGRVSPSRIERAATRAAERQTARIMARDLTRDGASKATRLRANRRVFRFTTKARATAAQREGFSPGTHFTATAGAGRPLSGNAAKKRYGLPNTPDRRLSVTLPEGTLVKPNKVIGGTPGYGEIRIENWISRESVAAEAVLVPGR